MLFFVNITGFNSNSTSDWTIKKIRVPDSPEDYACTKFGQNPLKDLDSSVHKDVMQHAHRFFHLRVHVPFYLHFWGCNVPSTYLGESGTLLIFKVIGQGHWVNLLPCNILVNTLESTSFNGF
jgi:hypothetical protein